MNGCRENPFNSRRPDLVEQWFLFPFSTRRQASWSSGLRRDGGLALHLLLLCLKREGGRWPADFLHHKRGLGGGRRSRMAGEWMGDRRPAAVARRNVQRISKMGSRRMTGGGGVQPSGAAPDKIRALVSPAAGPAAPPASGSRLREGLQQGLEYLTVAHNDGVKGGGGWSELAGGFIAVNFLAGGLFRRDDCPKCPPVVSTFLSHVRAVVGGGWSTAARRTLFLAGRGGGGRSSVLLRFLPLLLLSWDSSPFRDRERGEKRRGEEVFPWKPCNRSATTASPTDGWWTGKTQRAALSSRSTLDWRPCAGPLTPPTTSILVSRDRSPPPSSTRTRSSPTGWSSPSTCRRRRGGSRRTDPARRTDPSRRTGPARRTPTTPFWAGPCRWTPPACCSLSARGTTGRRTPPPAPASRRRRIIRRRRCASTLRPRGRSPGSSPQHRRRSCRSTSAFWCPCTRRSRGWSYLGGPGARPWWCRPPRGAAHRRLSARRGPETTAAASPGRRSTPAWRSRSTTPFSTARGR